MARRILLADDVVTNRIILKVKLSAAHYEVVMAENVDELVALARASQPDLVVISDSLPGGGVAQAVRGLDRAGVMRPPILAITTDDDRRARLAALSAGAEDVLLKPLDEEGLLAQVRSLVRDWTARLELANRHATAREFGLAEAPGTFHRQARIALVAPTPQTGLAWKSELARHLPHRIDVVKPGDVLDFSHDDEAEVPDAFVLAAEIARPGDGLKLMSELRSRERSRRSAFMVYLPRLQPDQATMAYDMGATGVFGGVVDGEDLALRLGRAIARKQEADALREGLDKQLDLALRDPLTRLYTRRYAGSYLAHSARAAKERGKPMTIMLLDLDRFKQVNDHYGHAVGDEVLVEVAARLQANLRETDLLARLGGEEFLVAMPETDEAEAQRTAERLRRVIGDTPVRSSSRGDEVAVTVSIGVVVAEAGGIDPGRVDGMIDRADQALYASKADGRNQITFVQTAA